MVTLQGGDLVIPTSGQQALSAELLRSKYITLRVTDVEEDEREQLLYVPKYILLYDILSKLG